MSIMMLRRWCMGVGFTRLDCKTILEKLMLHDINEDLQIVNIDEINTVKSNNGYSAQWRLTLTEQVLPTF